MHDLFYPSLPWWNLAMRAAMVYIAVILMLRLSGKRQVANLGLSELVALLLISNAVQNAMNGGDNSLVGGLLLAGVIMVMAFVIALLTYFSRDWERFIQGEPTLLIHKGTLLHKNLRKELLNIRELRVLLRKQGIHELKEIEEAVLESDGYISVIKKSEIVREHEYDDMTS